MRSVCMKASPAHLEDMYAERSAGAGVSTPPPVPVKTTRARRAWPPPTNGTRVRPAPLAPHIPVASNEGRGGTHVGLGGRLAEERQERLARLDLVVDTRGRDKRR